VGDSNLTAPEAPLKGEGDGSASRVEETSKEAEHSQQKKKNKKKILYETSHNRA
jgi:hypothetical protein